MINQEQITFQKVYKFFIIKVFISFYSYYKVNITLRLILLLIIKSEAKNLVEFSYLHEI